MIEERSKAIVELDGKQAKDELSELRDRAKQYRKELREMSEKNDLKGVQDLEKKLKDVNTQMAAAKKTTFDYNQVLKNLSGATIKEMERAQSALTRELKNTTRGTEEYIKKSKQLSLVRSEISKTRGDFNQFTTTQGKLTGLLTKAVSLVGGFYGAIKVGQAVIESSEAASDRWAVAMGGVSSALDYIKKSISTMDFANFFRNIQTAIERGQEYARQLDEIEDRNRAASMRDSEIRLQIQQQEKIYRDVLKSDKERIAAIDKILELEKEMVTVRKSIAEQAWKAKIEDVSKYGITEKDLIANLKNYDVNKLLINQADEYNKLLAEKNHLETLANSELKTKAIAQINEKLLSTNKDIVEFARIRYNYTKLDKEELDQLVQLYVELFSTQSAYFENTAGASAKRSKLIKGMHEAGTSINGVTKVGNQDPTANISEYQASELKRAEAEFNAYNEMIFEKLNSSIDESSALQLDHIKTNAEYDLELYYQTQQGKKDLLRQQLTDGVIAEKEYHDKIKQLDKESFEYKLQTSRETFSNAKSLFKEHTIAYKVLSIAIATIDTYQAANAAYKAMAGIPYVGPILGAIAAAAAIAAGLANVAKMRSTGFSSGGWTGPGDKYQPAGVVHADEYVINKRQMHDPKIRSLVTGVIEPDRVAHLNSDSSVSAVNNTNGYANGGPVSAPHTTNVTIDTDKMTQILDSIDSKLNKLNDLDYHLVSGAVKASYDDREVEKISKRQVTINKIKSSVRR